MYSNPTDSYLLSETQIDLTVVKKLCFENIIERPPLKARLGEVAREHWGNSLLNLVYCMFSCCVFPNQFNVYVFRNLIDPLIKYHRHIPAHESIIPSILCLG